MTHSNWVSISSTVASALLSWLGFGAGAVQLAFTFRSVFSSWALKPITSQSARRISGIDKYPEMVADAANRIRVHGTQYLLESLNADDRLLLVDDVYSSGKTMDVVISRLEQRLKRNMPTNIKTATIWSRSASGARKPDFFRHQTDDWLVLPYELTGLTADEISEHKPLVAELAND